MSTVTDPTPGSTPSPATRPNTPDGLWSRRVVRVAAACVVSVALVVVAMWAPLSARLTGEEITLRVAPFDPMDPFRGAYVDLGYPDLPGATPEFDESFTEEEMKENEEEAQRLEDERGTAYVPLTRQGEVWVGGPVQRTAPEDGLFLRCDDSSWRLECGIESWFLPQDEAAALDDAVRGGTAVAVVKVDAAGHAALTGILPR